MSIDPEVRPARAGDRDAVLALDAALASAVVDQRGGRGWLSEHPPIEFDPGSGLVWVGVVDDVPVGFLAARCSSDSRGLIMTVDRVFVDQHARDLGFGDDLLEACVNEARNRGCQAVEAVALPGDRDTKNLYERAGITARSIILSREL